ncbi:MAG: hypothetical protein AAF368_14720, partial [Planctomycetota bacterium]
MRPSTSLLFQAPPLRRQSASLVIETIQVEFGLGFEPGDSQGGFPSAGRRFMDGRIDHHLPWFIR